MTKINAATVLIIGLIVATGAYARLSFDPTEGGSASGGRAEKAATISPKTFEVDPPKTLELEVNKLLQASLKPEELHDDYLKLIKARMQHDIWQLEERESLYKWTNRVSFIIAIFVHLAVTLGVFAAGLEFWWASKTRQRSAKIQEIELSTEKIALKTSLQGMLLLLVSLGLYLFYLKYVYSIH